MLLDCRFAGQFGGVGAAEAVEDGGVEKVFAEGGGDESAEDDGGDWVEDFLAGEESAPDEGDESDACGEGGHEDGGEAFEAAADDELEGERFVLFLHEVEVVGDEEDAVAGGDPSEGDEADHACDGERLSGEPEGEDATDEGDRKCQHDLEDDARGGVEGVENEEDADEGGYAQQQDHAGGGLLGFELSANLNEVAFGKRDLRVDDGADVGDDGAEIAVGGVAADGDAATDVFAVDGVGSAGLVDFSDGLEGDAFAVGEIEGEAVEIGEVGAVGIVETDDEVEFSLAFEDGGDFSAVEGGLDKFIDEAWGDAELGEAFAVEFDTELGDELLRFDDGGGHAGDVLDGGFDFLGFLAEDVEVVAKEFDGDLGGDSGEHVADHMGEGLFGFVFDAGDFLEFSAERGEGLLAGDA